VFAFFTGTVRFVHRDDDLVCLTVPHLLYFIGDAGFSGRENLADFGIDIAHATSGFAGR